MTQGFLITDATSRRGQVMLVAVLAIGGAMLGATTIAGLLTTYQVRQTIDIANSAKAIYAADAGLEWALYLFFHPATTLTAPTFADPKTSFVIRCKQADGTVLASCTNATTTLIQAIGGYGDTRRAFELRLQ